MGSIVTVEPETLIRPPSVTEIVSTVVSSDFLTTTFFPDTAVTFSEKTKEILEAVATPVALSAGVDEDNVGAAVSATETKFKAVVDEIPA